MNPKEGYYWRSYTQRSFDITI